MDAKFIYSDKYSDDNCTYRHVCIRINYRQEVLRKIPKGRFMTETEVKQLGIQQSAGWEHYASHLPEPHILLFRRPLQ